MKILLVGSGGREHALAWRLRQDDPALVLFVAPGNAGTAALGTNLPLAASDLGGLVAWAASERPDLVVVGPEGPLCAGLVDRLAEIGVVAFGPRQKAARLEGSKIFSKEFLFRHRLPTAPGRCCTDIAAARAYLRTRSEFPQVIKADGLAGGKGVVIAPSLAAAEQALGQIMIDRVFGEAGAGVVIEDFTRGRELSVHVLTDGSSSLVLPIAQDHKKLRENETGPNTGGMGAYAPAPFATLELHAWIERDVVGPVLSAVRAEGIAFCGVLYIGLIWTATGPSILEFNVRFGDPETQVLLPLLETPLLDILQAVVEKRLGTLAPVWRAQSAVTLVLAAPGYPEAPQIDAPISGLEIEQPGTFVFHAGTRAAAGAVLTSGGRVLTVTAWAPTLALARERAYHRAAKIDFPGRQMRFDIAARLSLE